LITERYQYAPLTRESVEGQRLYATPDGRKLPSVTTILDRTKPAEKRVALENWRRRVGHEKAQQITTEAANRGTRMHSYLEHYVKTGTHRDAGTNPFSWPSHAMAEKVIQQGLNKVTEFWGTEVPLYFPQIYAGTTDCVGLHEGRPAILDFKQTNRPKKTEWIEDYFLQLAAYAEAHNEVHGTQIRRGVILMCAKPDLDDQGRVISEPQYQEWIVEGAEFEQWRQRWWARVEQYYQSHA
jgi:ATP-dependent exoDNAse (exonuclease V) beta subunit